MPYLTCCLQFELGMRILLHSQINMHRSTRMNFSCHDRSVYMLLGEGRERQSGAYMDTHAASQLIYLLGSRMKRLFDANTGSDV